ncbi:hypothetical protein PoB_003646500 [Plakobranchus ocellatus]|uniref:Uncharacterized protein n=1 Tax=Plakobranchus ocellatus TaxID=259542 RepID=A0AAV4ASU1_9GAST|nr:hypothetical protein PoB_003646500 [Plakobranchus ocellatus]
MWFIRRKMRISLTEKKSNELVMKEANLVRSLIKTIRQRQPENSFEWRNMSLIANVCSTVPEKIADNNDDDAITTPIVISSLR